MGARGPAPKPAYQRQRRNKDERPLVVVPPGERSPGRPSAPSPPRRRWLRATERAWGSFWGSDVASLVTPADMGALQRLHDLYDERERALRGYRKQRLVEGSMGQRVINPLGRAIATFDAEIRALEDRFGLTPQARLRLGVVFGEARRSLDQINRDLDAEIEADEDEDDPRLPPAN
jgi:P27 family predicted phage terminase small subunit